jgi:small subunit ribosomal protein S9
MLQRQAVFSLRRCYGTTASLRQAFPTGSTQQSSRLDALRAGILGRTQQTTANTEDVDNDPRKYKAPPTSPSFYTARPVFYDQVAQLERAIATANNALRRAQLLPLPAFARASLPPIHPVWQTKEEMTSHFQTKMTLARYRKVTKLLNELNDYHRIANTAGVNDLANKIYSIVSLFESSKKDAFLARGKRKPVVLDVYGRSYTVGKRKTSSARVWMIPVQESSSASSESESKAPLPMTTILVNNIPLNEYFPLPADRERITRPLKVAGILGKYNVFSIVRGGGTTGQSGALAHGIAKGVVAHEPDLETLFRRGTSVLFFLFRPTANFRFLSVAKLTRRDPRMVERKKTGLAKARKRVRTFRPSLCCPFPLTDSKPSSCSTPGSSGSSLFLLFHRSSNIPISSCHNDIIHYMLIIIMLPVSLYRGDQRDETRLDKEKQREGTRGEMQ